jgi:NADP-reducing hydrogenase subunit HndD
MTDVNLSIDGQAVTVPEGTTILQASQRLSKTIPTICYHPHFTAPSLCRVCVVEVEKSRVLVQACSRQVEQGMVVLTHSPRVELARKLILEMLESAVDTSDASEIRRYSHEYGTAADRFGQV